MGDCRIPNSSLVLEIPFVVFVISALILVVKKIRLFSFL